MKIGIAGYPHLIHNYEAALYHSIQWLYPLPDERTGTACPAGSRSPHFQLETACSLSIENARDWDALILPGGGDIDPSCLPGFPKLHPACDAADPQLDKSQLNLLDLFVHQKKPVLGICKGMQLINLYFGGDLSQHLPTAQRHCFTGTDQLHPAYAKPGSFLQTLYGPRTIVNSAHHQGIIEGATPLGKNIAVIQRSADGVAEAIIHNYLPVIGLQWHPERLCGRLQNPNAADGSLVFQYFLQQI